MRIILASAAAALSLVATPAIANTEIVEVRVSIADLDLDSAAGRTALEARVDRAVRAACEVRHPLGRNAAKTDWECVKTAKAAALAQVETANEREAVAMAAE